MSKDNALLMPFEDESPSFVNGFEIGQMWEKMNRTEDFDGYLFHTENKKQVEMMCKRFHFSCRIYKVDETWSSLYAEITAEAN